MGHNIKNEKHSYSLTLFVRAICCSSEHAIPSDTDSATRAALHRYFPLAGSSTDHTMKPRSCPAGDPALGQLLHCRMDAVGAACCT